MKRLIFTPLLLIFLISCSNQKNKIFSGEWISYEEINNKEYPSLYAKVDFKFIDCIKNICQYKFRIKYKDIQNIWAIEKVYCDTLEVQQIESRSDKRLLPRRALRFDNDFDNFALRLCNKKKG